MKALTLAPGDWVLFGKQHKTPRTVGVVVLTSAQCLILTSPYERWLRFVELWQELTHLEKIQPIPLSADELRQVEENRGREIARLRRVEEEARVLRERLEGRGHHASD